MQKRLDVQKTEYEEAIKRHISFIDQANVTSSSSVVLTWFPGSSANIETKAGLKTAGWPKISL